ncbi:MAG: hypothetical protein APG12_00630 [Candidatus Methanofastidiosum methylothiophilum]|uniref:Uncharacterized protein n=1 Tax=Candidatus Methanofastidiosum methylothiophilum TaxID=1705564 RepID=A0A150J0V7_9EURY|nr:MAG: hypothetical protein APG10_00579 [Candidatus Methanofastidiosum methylthiophilus]KYC48028.1 MAG: hypothetical protein APG11_00698 [Candidatus Methanofastidiosum methylthiophilus]KYC50718.1 MAG: hypothetical protein APG12_00630 [Candidatus Methanofastidiosum methylthiophilus]
MNYYVLIPSLLLGLLFGRFILNRFNKPNELVWFIIVSFFGINIIILLLDRFILPNYYMMDEIKAFVPGTLVGVYLYLILAVLGVFKPRRNSYPKNI